MAYEIIDGTIVRFSTDDGTTFKELKKVDEIPEFGTDGSFYDTTSVADTTKEYTGGIADTPDQAWTFKEVKGDSDQIAFLTAADARQTVLMQIELPSGSTIEWYLATSGYKTSGSEVMRHTVNGKQSGKPVFSRAA